MTSARTTSYGSLAATLREAILTGDYGDDDRLPTEAELAASRGVSRQTVRRAMQELVNEGLVYRVAGRGTYPVSRSDRYLRHLGSVEDLMSLSLDTDCVIVRPLQRRVDAAAASRLRVPGDSVHSVSFIRRHGSVPFCHTDVALPSDVGEQLEGNAALRTAGAVSRVTVIGLVDTLADRPIRDAEQSVTATTLPAELAAHLVPPPGTAVLRIDRLYFDPRDQPVELAVSHFDPDHYSYRVRLRRHPR
ncbi:GntR family transcriptional regulator [Jatrophihabitans sp. YIM 134969]